MIRRADLDGADLETVVTITGQSLRGLGLDLGDCGALYWAYPNSGGSGAMLQRSDFDGNNIEDLVSTVDGGNRQLDLLLWDFPLGDFDSDNQVTPVDIDLLRTAIHLNDSHAKFSVNCDKLLNRDDMDHLIEVVLGTAYGDADLNKIVDFSDFIALSNNFGLSDTGWGQGNFNLDFQTDFIDFVILSINFGTDLSTAAVAVPEPVSMLLVGISALWCTHRRHVPLYRTK